MNKAIYYLIDKDKEFTPADFIKITSLVGELHGVGITLAENEENTAYIFYENPDFPYRPKLTLDRDEQLSLKGIKVETEITDFATAYLLREVLTKQGIRVFFVNLNCYLPKNYAIHDCLTLSKEDFVKASKIMAGNGLKPVFKLEDGNVYYAQDEKDNSIHLVNDNLLAYLMLLEKPNVYSDEFSYKVADNLADFVEKFDAGLVPTTFYKYFKKSFKIMNFSGLDLENPGRKIFVKPIIMLLDSDKMDFFKIASDNSALLFMDKIRTNESLDKTILRIIREELKVADDYVGATVSSFVEFDLDKSNVLTPRVFVYIYLKEVHLSKEQLEKKDRTWISMNQVK